MAEEERLRRVTDLVRELRRRLDESDDPDILEIALYSYDEALVTAADILDLEVPARMRDEMGPDDRAALEAALAEAGLDVTG